MNEFRSILLAENHLNDAELTFKPVHHRDFISAVRPGSNESLSGAMQHPN